jgi:predicted ester cyclase
LIAEGDLVVAHHTHHVIHGGQFMDMPPTGKEIAVQGLEIFRLADGRSAEMWHQDDMLSLFQQLGMIRVPEVADAP